MRRGRAAAATPRPARRLAPRDCRRACPRRWPGRSRSRQIPERSAPGATARPSTPQHAGNVRLGAAPQVELLGGEASVVVGEVAAVAAQDLVGPALVFVTWRANDQDAPAVAQRALVQD